jgi:hypothetical protein
MSIFSILSNHKIKKNSFSALDLGNSCIFINFIDLIIEKDSFANLPQSLIYKKRRNEICYA